MGLNIALDELRATGWMSLDSTGCAYDADGRVYPNLERVEREFASAGYSLELKRVDRFKCVRATWRHAGPENAGAQSGSVVAQTPEEAAVYALAQLRRARMTLSTC